MSSGVGRKFHFIREIASGGFGSVYLAKVIHGDGFARLAAIKLLHPKWSENQEIASRMRDEARLLGWLRHRNIVEVLDLTRISGRVAVIMEYLEAVDVKVVLGAAVEQDERIPVRACLEICLAVGSALDAAYNRPPYAGEKPLHVIHRDIKPSNVMVDTSGQVKVLDFGVARADFAEREAHTQEMTFGSIDYMPAERMFFEPDTPKSDVYSLGATLYEMLAREKFGKARLRQSDHDDFVAERWQDLLRDRRLPSALTEPMRELVTAMLAFDGEDRPTAAECVARMRILARKCDDEGVGEWAESFVAPLVAAAQSRPNERSQHSLVDQVLAEDSRGFVHPDEQPSEVSDHPVLPAQTTLSMDDDEDLDHSGRMSDEQWHKLKQATLADLDPAPVVQRRASAERRPVPPPEEVGRAPSRPTARRDTYEAPSVVEPQPTRRRRGAGLLVLAILAGFSLLVLGLVAVLLAIGSASLLNASSAPPPAVAATVPSAPPPTPAASPVEAAAPTGPGATFKSGVPTTKRLTVRCDEAEGEGASEVFVAGEQLGDCTVTAVDQDRTRITAIVKKVKPRAYECFAGGEKDCR